MFPRIGAFFFLVGLVLFVLFLGTVFSQHLQFDFLWASLGAFLFAYLFRRRTSQDSGRFHTLRRMNENNRRRREERAQREAMRDDE